MSFNPTISVYLNGKIVDTHFYNDWNVRNLVYEAIALGYLYSPCTSQDDYRTARYGGTKLCYMVGHKSLHSSMRYRMLIADPRMYRYDPEEDAYIFQDHVKAGKNFCTTSRLKELENYSDYPLVLDLTNQAIYYGFRPKTQAELEKLPPVSSSLAAAAIRTDSEDNFGRLMTTHRIPLDMARRDRFIRVLARWGTCHHGLSRETVLSLREAAGMEYLAA